MKDNHKSIATINSNLFRFTPYQHREWVLWRMADERNFRVVSAACKLAGPVDEKILEERLKKAMKCHLALQLIFNTEKPEATIISEINVPIVTKYARINEDLAKAASRIFCEIVTKPFPISSSVLPLRTVLIRADFNKANDCALLVIAHPIIADEKSLECLLREIETDEIPEATDDIFLKWDENSFASHKEGVYNQKLESYKQLLKGSLFDLDMPTDRARPAVYCSKGRFFKITVPEQVKEIAEQLSTIHNFTKDAIVIAALGCYICRLSRQQDIVIGLVVDLRMPGSDTSIGSFENTAILRIRIEDKITGLELIRQVQESLTTLKSLRDLPFEALTETFNPDRDASRTPIFQLCFAHRNYDGYKNLIPMQAGRLRSDLDIVLEQAEGNDVLRIGYRYDLYRRDTIENMAGHIIKLIMTISEKPDEPVQSYQIGRSNEHAWVLSALGVQNTYPCETPIHKLVAAAASRNPEKIAVCSEDTQISYELLNRRANQLAHRLRSLGVGPDVPVAVCMDRSAELIIALLAILKAGGAYVPIEPANPSERIEFVLADSKAQFLLTESDQKSKVAGASIQTIMLEPGGAAFASEPVANPVEVVGPENLAYIIYTSGSTGRPKGVLIEHRNVVRLFRATEEWFHFSENDVWTMFHSVAFDFSVWEIWGALIHGGRLVVVPYLTSRSPLNFYELLVNEKVTVLNQTPSAFNLVIQAEVEGDSRKLALRHIIFGGEALELESLRPWFERHGDQFPRLANMYGITETCVHVTYRPLSMTDLDSGLGSSVIGLPIPDLSTYVVDENLQLLPPGVPGELVVGGAGLARGYHDRPELTAERFVPDPFSQQPDAMFYRSGDLVRILPTGELDYLGRIDQQVQIRGFRIETGEIESVIRRSGFVQDVVVVPWQRESNETLLVAYVVSDRTDGELRVVARESLPEYMVPDHFVTVPNIPMTTNGKVDRKALPAPQSGSHCSSADVVAPTGELELVISEIWGEVLGTDKISVNDSFFDIGGTSLGLVRVATKLRECIEIEISVVVLFQYPTVSSLAKYLAKYHLKQEPSDIRPSYKGSSEAEDEPIAIIGMAGRFPGAENIEALWTLLRDGKEAISFFEESELDPTLDPSLVSRPDYVRARGVLRDADFFDAGFFGMNPGEAEVTDPQHRVLMEVAWEALEHAGIDPTSFPGLIATYAGVYNNSYYTENVLKRLDVVDKVGLFQAMIGNEKDFVAPRISHRLGLNGPAISIQTACSTSLVAVSQAFFALRTGQCDLALAGAAAVTCPQMSGYIYQEDGMLSADGHTRPFDAQATGTVFSDGAAMVALRPLSKAIESGDSIYAIIRGAATNNDGGQRMSFSAPTVKWQAEVITRALSVAGVNPETIGYIEAHGTATPLGDPIEFSGLRQAFGQWTNREGYCALGSIKSNIGHLTAPSGVAGLIKTVLSLERELIPASLGFSQPNPEITFKNSPFFVTSESMPWPRQPGKPRIAGVSSFGVGGTNAHVVVEEAPALPPSGPSRSHQLLVLSAKTDTALEKITENLAFYLEKKPETNLADTAFTLQNGRKVFPYRRMLVASSAAEAMERLKALDPKYAVSGSVMNGEPSVTFMFPGQGAQHLNMGRNLYQEEAVFRNELDRCAKILKLHLDLDLRTVLYPESSEPESADRLINDTWLSQPAIFVIEYALARLWMSWGIQPAVMVGHSIGEYVAAVIAETFSLEDALSLLSVRARLMQNLPPGSMLSVRLSVDKVEPILPDGISIAAVNSQALCVISGQTDNLQALKLELDAKGVANKFLHTSHAFHSAMMDPMLSEFATVARQIPFQPPKIPWLSTCTGQWMTPADLVDGDYWVRQVRQAVRFADALTHVIGQENQILLEVGPGQTLSQLAQQHKKKAAGTVIMPSFGPVGESEQDLPSMLLALGRLWIAGTGISWNRFSSGEQRRRVPLPSYPFERKSYWIQPPKVDAKVDRIKAFEFDDHKQDRLKIKKQEDVLKPQKLDPKMKRQSAGKHERDTWITGKLLDLFEEISGEEIDKDQFTLSFLELGFDSLLLTQISTAIKNTFQIEVTFRKLLEELTNFDLLISYLSNQVSDEILPSELISTVSLETETSSNLDQSMQQLNLQKRVLSDPSVVSVSVGEDINVLFSRQLAVIENQLDLIKRFPKPDSAKRLDSSDQIKQKSSGTNVEVKQQLTSAVGSKGLDEGSDSKFVGPQTRIQKSSSALTVHQKEFIERLINRYVKKTKRSKVYTAKHRPHLSDPRVVSGFSPILKEMVYPIVTRRSKGSHLWDIDDNEYVDWLNGFGSNFFGYSAPFIVEAVKKQINKGIEIGPQHELVGEVADIVCQVTNSERAAFCNTGSEAVLGALRIARTVTGRNTVVMFSGAYHGIFNEVINRGTKKYTTLPAAPGITRDSVKNMLVLDYDNPESLNVLRKRGKDIAAILVEPVQSRAPEIQPRMFLAELRKIADENDAALIFDEIVTGFRTCLGGAQEYFDVRADIATYGKVIGGGWPIGVIAGRKRYMDALDGGSWQYGDNSIPEVGVTYFAGTFVRHPPALAAAKAALTYLIDKGPGLQEKLNLRCTQMVDRLNLNLSILGAPVQIRQFASIMKIEFTEDVQYGDLLFYLLREKNVHVWHHRPCFLTIAHSGDDIDYIVEAFLKSVKEMQQAQFLPKFIKDIENAFSVEKTNTDKPPILGARLGKDREGNPAWFINDPERPGKYLQMGVQD